MKDNLTYLVVALILVIIIVVAVNGTSATGNSIYRGTAHACTDTDKSNYKYVYGEVEFLQGGQVVVYGDKCLDNLHVRDYYCSGPNRLNSLSHFCPNGCVGGTCRSDSVVVN